jgi:hypothetical protein
VASGSIYHGTPILHLMLDDLELSSFNAWGPIIRKETLKMRILIAALSTVAIIPFAYAQQSQTGTAEEARAMLVKVIAAVKADRELALIQIAKGEAGFKDRDLYPYCSRVSDGKALAGPLAVMAGTDARTLKDPNGKAFGAEQFEVALKNPEGQITELSGYMFPKPGTIAPAVPRVSFITQVNGLVCGVGYYK